MFTRLSGCLYTSLRLGVLRFVVPQEGKDLRLLLWTSGPFLGIDEEMSSVWLCLQKGTILVLR